jgi:hypothetical protein
MSDRRDRRGFALAAVCAIGLLWILKQDWNDWQERPLIEQIKHDSAAAGVEVIDEEPIPLRLAENRESLIASIIALALIAAAMITYWMGLWGNR